jgi:hypothetical protein
MGKDDQGRQHQGGLRLRLDASRKAMSRAATASTAARSATSPIVRCGYFERMLIDLHFRHPRESGDPVAFVAHRDITNQRRWIPAFAGMTAEELVFAERVCRTQRVHRNGARFRSRESHAVALRACRLTLSSRASVPRISRRRPAIGRRGLFPQIVLASRHRAQEAIRRDLRDDRARDTQ